MAGFPEELFNTPYRSKAFRDFLTRVFASNINRYYDNAGGTGKSGILTIDRCGQEILDRTSIVIRKNSLEARFEVGLPAAGRRVLGKSAASIFMVSIPKIVTNSLLYKNIDAVGLKKQVELSDDQHYIREELKKRKLIAFVANGSILPRESGISDKPLKSGAVPFASPRSMEVEMNLPNSGPIKGMGIPEGVTLIVGGGYHGKSTLLNALERGVYDHIEGDGRELVITRDNAVKIRAEDGRGVEGVDISPFINNLPNGQDTGCFSTQNASGSTSQAANIIEAIEIGTEVLLIDEDTSATNFMIRDERMRKLVAGEKEPITPFIDKVRQLYEQLGVSTVIVVGGSGDYFDVADRVLMMDEFHAVDVTSRAKEIAMETGCRQKETQSTAFGGITRRIILKSSFSSRGPRGITIKAKGLHSVLYNKTPIALSSLEQLVDVSQTNCLAVMLKYFIENILNDRATLAEAINLLYEVIEKKGLDEVSPYSGHPGNLALPRKHEFGAMINRFRELKIRQSVL